MQMTVATNDRQGTATLARVFAEQGHWEKAAAIYRNLLQQDPQREDLKQALAEAEAGIRAAGRTLSPDLVPLFRQWIALLLQYDRLRKLRRLLTRL
jgi:cytochrome c-type biogenesis protein CcmH/NrfG